MLGRESRGVEAFLGPLPFSLRAHRPLLSGAHFQELLLQPLGAGQGHQIIKHKTIWIVGFPGVSQRFRYIAVFRISFNCFRSYSASVSSKTETPTHRTNCNNRTSGIIHLLSGIPSGPRCILSLTPSSLFPTTSLCPKYQPFLHSCYHLSPIPSQRSGVRALCFPSILCSP